MMAVEKRNELLSDLFDQHYESVFHYCCAYVHYEARFFPLVDDCIQDAFVSAILHYNEYSHYENPIGWIARAARNRLRSECRKARNRAKHMVPYELDETIMDSSVLETDIERWMDRQFAAEKLKAIYQLLTEKEQVIYKDYFELGHSMAEVAKKNGMSSNTVRSGIERIRKRAKQHSGLFIFLFLGRCIFQFWSTM